MTNPGDGTLATSTEDNAFVSIELTTIQSTEIHSSHTTSVARKSRIIGSIDQVSRTPEDRFKAFADATGSVDMGPDLSDRRDVDNSFTRPISLPNDLIGAISESHIDSRDRLGGQVQDRAGMPRMIKEDDFYRQI